MSIRRACRVLEIDTLHLPLPFASTRSGRPQSPRSRRSAQTRVRYGYRRVMCCCVARAGTSTTSEPTALQGAGLATAQQDAEAAGQGEAARRSAAGDVRPNDVWAMDFVHDQLATGQKIRVLTVVDTFSRFSPVLDRAVQLPRRGRGRRRWSAPARQVGYPKTIRVDQGTEFVSRDLDLWAYAKGVTLDFSRPGKPTDNAFIEAFNGRFRAECLNAHWFLTLADARRKLEDWRRYYNEDRPHGAIGNKFPIRQQNHDGVASPSGYVPGGGVGGGHRGEPG